MTKPESSCKGGGNRPFSRRSFLAAAGAAGLAAVSGCGKKNPTGPPAETPWTPPALPNRSIVSVAEVTGYTRRELRNALVTMFDDLGGIGDVVSGKTVGIKVNCTGGASNAGTTPPAVEMFWTHPEVLKAVGELLKDAGAKTLYVIEAVYDDASFRNFGFSDAATYLGATLVDLNGTAPGTAFVKRSVGGGYILYPTLTQNSILDRCDCIVSLPKAKQHAGAGVTHAMKNLVGTLPMSQYSSGFASNRTAIHNHRELDQNINSNLRRVVVDLNQATPIHLAVTDAIKTALSGEGPWIRGFRAATFNRLVASKDPVAADSIATKVIGFDPMAGDGEGVWGGQDQGNPGDAGINYLKLASEKGLGNYDLQKIEVKGTAV
jgi:uncharacterized protein (DUF362 family)